MLDEVLEYFPLKIKNKIHSFVYNKNMQNKIEEIRFRINQNICLKVGQDLISIDYILDMQDMKETFENICEKSVYSYTKQISNGYITIRGGNRVGITGTCVIENEKVININYISSLNFRIARQIKEVSVPLLKYIIDIENNSIFNTIIASPPGARKNNNFKRFNKKDFRWNRRNKF